MKLTTPAAYLVSEASRKGTHFAFHEGQVQQHGSGWVGFEAGSTGAMLSPAPLRSFGTPSRCPSRPDPKVHPALPGRH